MCAAVVETAGEVTDVLSFYTLPSTVIGNPKHSSLKAAYSCYNVARTVELKDLMQDGERHGSGPGLKPLRQDIALI